MLVGTGNLVDGCVTHPKIANNAVEAINILDGTITPAKLAYNVDNLVAYNQTQASRDLAASGDGLVQTLVLSNANANYDRLFCFASGYSKLTSPSGTHVYARIKLHNGAGVIGNEFVTHIINSGATSHTAHITFCVPMVLIAGTHYTKGTGFTLGVHASNAGSAGGGQVVYCNNLIVEGRVLV